MSQLPTTSGNGNGGSHSFTTNIPKLNGKNFVSWLEMITIAFKIRGLSETLTNPDVDEMLDLQARLALYETMDESHRTQVRGCNSTRTIVERLQQVYADNSASNLYRLLHNYFRYSKKQTDSISEHVGKMAEMRAALADIGEKQTEALFHVAVIASLPESYSNILEVWELAHESMRTTPNLISRLLKREEDLKRANEGSSAFAVRKPFNELSIAEKKKLSKCKNCGEKGHWYAECTKPKQPANKPVVPEKANQVIRANVSFNVMDETDFLKNLWIADTGASAHMCNQVRWFSELEKFEKPTTCVVGDGKQIAVTGRGTVKVLARVDGNLIEVALNNVLLIPSLATNLISVGSAASQGIKATFEEGECKMERKSDGLVVTEGRQISNGLYLLDMSAEKLPSEVALVMQPARTYEEWHRALGHASKERIINLLQDDRLKLKVKAESNNNGCTGCAMGKGKRVPHPLLDRKEETIGALVHVDLSGKVNKGSNDGFFYYLLCKDEASEFCNIYFLKDKTEVAAKLNQLLIDFEQDSGQQIKRLRSDNGSEFVNSTVRTLLAKERVTHDTTAVYSPEQNGVCEREMGAITNMARTMLIASQLPTELWAHALAAACYIRNRLPTSRSKITPFERLKGRLPDVSHIIEFGSEVQVIRNGEYLTKFDSRTEKGFVVGYTERRNTYLVFLEVSKRVIKTTDIILSGGTRDSSSVIIVDESSTNVLQTGRMESGRGPEKPSPESEDHFVTTNEWLEDGGICTGRDLDDFFEEFRRTENALNSTLRAPPEPSPEKEQDPCGEDSAEIPSPSYSTFTDRELDCSNDGQEVEYPPPALIEHSSAASDVSDLPEDLVLLTVSNGDEPKTFQQAIHGAESNLWKQAIEEELDAHATNVTWRVVERPKSGVSLSTRWVFTKKRNQSGEVEKFKARLVARGFEQRYGVDYLDTFAPVAKIESLRMVLALSVINKWKITQFDVNTAFLNGVLPEDVFIEAPEGVQLGSNQCLKLNKALYGLKQAPKCWNSCFNQALEEMEFTASEADKCVYKENNGDRIILVYVDDGLIVGPEGGDALVEELDKRFRVKRLSGESFLGMQIIKTPDGLKICQQRYVMDVLNKFSMTNAKVSSTPLADVRNLLENGAENQPTDQPYREAVGCLQYLANCTRPDISFAVNYLAKYNQKPLCKHWEGVKRVLRYIKGTINSGIVYESGDLKILAYSDADWANSETDRTSVSGVLITCANGPVIYGSRRQKVVALSSTEAEYIAACEAAREIAWINQLAADLKVDLPRPTLFIDNHSTIKQIKNPDTKKRSKHIDVRFHYIRQQYLKKDFDLQPIASDQQLADILTKAIAGPKLSQHCRTLKMTAYPDLGVFVRASLLALTMALVCAGLPWTETEPLFYMPTNNKVSTGSRQVAIELKLVDHCQTSVQFINLTSALDVKKKSYDILFDQCKKMFIDEVEPAFNMLKTCTNLARDQKKPSRRFKREPITLTGLAIAGGITAAVGGGTGVYTYFSSGSSYNRLNQKDIDDEKRNMRLNEIDNLVKDVTVSLINGKEVRKDLLNKHGELNSKVLFNKLAIIQLAELSPEIAWTSSKLHYRLAMETQAFMDMLKSCRRRRLNTLALWKLIGEKTLLNLDSEDTHVEEVSVNEDGSVTFVVTYDIIDTDTDVLEVTSFDHFENYTVPRPILLKYIGPQYVLYNRSSNCLKATKKPLAQQHSYEVCYDTDYYEPRLNEWKRVEANLDHIQPVLYKTASELYGFCPTHKIKVNTKTLSCPLYPFVMSKANNVSLPSINHTYEKVAWESNRNRVKVEFKGLTSNIDEEFERETRALNQLRKLNDESLKIGEVGYKDGTIAMPIGTAIWVGFGFFLGLCSITGTIYACFFRSNLSTAQTVEKRGSINIFNGSNGNQPPAEPIYAAIPTIYSTIQHAPIYPNLDQGFEFLRRKRIRESQPQREVLVGETDSASAGPSRRFVPPLPTWGVSKASESSI